jgi:hypothetical protein
MPITANIPVSPKICIAPMIKKKVPTLQGRVRNMHAPNQPRSALDSQEALRRQNPTQRRYAAGTI